jgi:hypothetical protein
MSSNLIIKGRYIIWCPDLVAHFYTQKMALVVTTVPTDISNWLLENMGLLRDIAFNLLGENPDGQVVSFNCTHVPNQQTCRIETIQKQEIAAIDPFWIETVTIISLCILGTGCAIILVHVKCSLPNHGETVITSILIIKPIERS